MDMATSPAPRSDADADGHALNRIAMTLGVSLDAFSDPALLAEMDARNEMLRLWDALDGPDARRAALDVLRVLAGGRRA